MSETPDFLASAPSIYTEMVWVPTNHPTLHKCSSYQAQHELVSFRKEAPFYMAFSLNRLQVMADLLPTLFYGDSWTRPHEFMGLSQLYGARDPNQAQNAVNVLDGGGKDGLTSIYLVGWHERHVYMAYHVDKAGDLWCAIVPQDWRYIVRIANVDENTDLEAAMAHATFSIPTFHSSRSAFYMDEPAHRALGSAATFRGIPIFTTNALRRDENRVI